MHLHLLSSLTLPLLALALVTPSKPFPYGLSARQASQNCTSGTISGMTLCCDSLMKASELTALCVLVENNVTVSDYQESVGMQCQSQRVSVVLTKD